MKAVALIMLLMIAAALFAQEVLVPGESMNSARDEHRKRFESLSSGYDGPLGRRYAHKDGDGYRRRDARGARVNSAPDDSGRPVLPQDNSLGENNRDLRRCARRLILIKKHHPVAN